MKLKILICNDDGFHAPGLVALYNAVAGLGDIMVAAPATEQSGTAHAVTVSNPIKIKKQKFHGEIEGYSVTGTPADCVKIAISVLLEGKPDLIISGINFGPNVGISVVYSGTVSAAGEGTLLDIPSMAVSLDAVANPCWETAGHIAARMAAEILRNGLPPATMLNVNVPNLPLGEIKGLAVTRVGKSRFAEVFHRRTMPRGGDYYWLDGDLEALEDVNGPGFAKGFAEARTDIEAVKKGYVSVTPVSFDLTNHTALAEITKWGLRL